MRDRIAHVPPLSDEPLAAPAAEPGAEPAAAPPSVTVEERLFSLVLALVATELGLTKAEILATVQGYRQRYTTSGSNASLERQFERDKEDIRDLGIPLDVIEPIDDPGSNHNLRYRIPKGLYDLPADVVFSPDEIMLLKLAATVWREGSLSADSRRALTKLNSLGVDSQDPVLGYAPHLRSREASFEPLNKAMDRGLIVSFAYLKPGETQSHRRCVAPRAIVLHEGRWHLFATDQDAGAPRTFLLSRIVGPVVPVPGRTFEADSAGAAQEALDGLDVLWKKQVAVIYVVPGSDAEVRLGKRGTLETGAEQDSEASVALHFTDLNILADELAGFGPEAIVLSPPALRAAVLARLRVVHDAHADVS